MDDDFREWKRNHGYFYEKVHKKKKWWNRIPDIRDNNNMKLKNLVKYPELCSRVAIRLSPCDLKHKLTMEEIKKDNRLKKKLSLESWYRITLPHGNKYSKDYLVQTFSEELKPLLFWPIAWETKGNIVTFYVDDVKVSDQLQVICADLKMPDDYKLMIRVNVGSPNIEITNDFKEKLKIAMSNRYDSITKYLNLTKFHSEPILQDYFGGLNKQVVFLAVLNIIEENIPELEGLNLNNNNIRKLKFLKDFISKMNNIKILDLSNNKIETMEHIEPLTKLPNLEELFLRGNPVCQLLEEGREYFVSEVRDQFRQIKKLDGIELPTRIVFDIDLSAHMPAQIQTYLCKPDYSAMVGEFLKQYYELYDKDRSLLKSAYHKNILFSYNSSIAYGTEIDNIPFLHYRAYCRNILRDKNLHPRLRCLRKSWEEVLRLVSDWPSTIHDIRGFKVDLTLVTPTMICLNVSGVFKETSKEKKVRSFFRSLVIVPSGTGFTICNEELSFTNATNEQKTDFFKRMPFTDEPMSSSNTAAQVQGPSKEVVKENLISSLANRSGMNNEWSIKCLVDTQWNLQQAINTFSELNVSGGVPPEAFIK